LRDWRASFNPSFKRVSCCSGVKFILSPYTTLYFCQTETQKDFGHRRRNTKREEIMGSTSYPEQRRYSVILSKTGAVFSIYPTWILHFIQSKPRIFPVVWLWSTLNLRLKIFASRLQTAQQPFCFNSICVYCSVLIPNLRFKSQRLWTSLYVSGLASFLSLRYLHRFSLLA
jgi:hypothetical protein